MTDETTNPIRDAIQSAIDDHEVILFMKGTPDTPACGFSARTVGALQALGAPFAAVDILPDPRIREELSAISEWPTIPQLFVNGKLVGGADIVTAIRTLSVRGAPLIGVAAAYGLAMEAAAAPSAGAVDEGWRVLRDSRPTGANLGWAVDRVRDAALAAGPDAMAAAA